MSNVVSLCEYRKKRHEEKALNETIWGMTDEQIIDLLNDISYTYNVDDDKLSSFTFSIELSDEIKDPS